MIRKATFSDIEAIEATYDEHFKYETEHEAFTVFKKEIYPTRKDAVKALQEDSLYVYEENGNILASIIIDSIQPAEYSDIPWNYTGSKAMVIHLLMARPSAAGKGIATALIKYAETLARDNHCKALQLDTGSQNTPAISLYKKLGFQIVIAAPMKVGGMIEHSNHLFLEKVL